MKFTKDQKVEVKIGDGWLSGTVAFVWRGIELESKRRIFHYDVKGQTVEGLAWELKKIPEELLRRPNRGRGRRRVLRFHSIRPELLT